MPKSKFLLLNNNSLWIDEDIKTNLDEIYLFLEARTKAIKNSNSPVPQFSFAQIANAIDLSPKLVSYYCMLLAFQSEPLVRIHSVVYTNPKSKKQRIKEEGTEKSKKKVNVKVSHKVELIRFKNENPTDPCYTKEKYKPLPKKETYKQSWQMLNDNELWVASRSMKNITEIYRFLESERLDAIDAEADNPKFSYNEISEATGIDKKQIRYVCMLFAFRLQPYVRIIADKTIWKRAEDETENNSWVNCNTVELLRSTKGNELPGLKNIKESKKRQNKVKEKKRFGTHILRASPSQPKA